MASTPVSQRGGEQSPEYDARRSKTRSLRKGTRSCWECKRRKIRCVYKFEGDSACLPCRGRRTNCVSQEFPEQTSARDSPGQLSMRLEKVETILSQLVEEITSLRKQNVLTPTSMVANVEASSAPIKTIELQDQLPPSSQPEHAALSEVLLATFPSQIDLEELCKTDCYSPTYFQEVNTTPHIKLEHDGIKLAGNLARLPPPSTHPVLLAKRMLVFALFLQQLPSHQTGGLSEHPQAIMKRLADTAIKLVTTNEELYGSTECLECIILEGVYQSNTGNLRRSWFAFRRAMMVAKMMGIHRPDSLPPRSIDPTANIDPRFLWFRIVYMDRFFSLMLGLPQGTTDKSMASGAAMENDTPTGQLERVHAVVAARILERNERGPKLDDFEDIQRIDSELLRAAKTLPDEFWLPPTFLSTANYSMDAFWESMRLVDQLYHYTLLNMLHLPYLLRSKIDSRYEYSRVTSVNASREILTRFVAFRNFNRITCCCRPAEFFALMAALTLLLAHLDSHCHRAPHNFLAHQRLGDRAILTQVLENMELLAKLNGDLLTEKSALLLRRLLFVEEDASQGLGDSCAKLDSADGKQEDESIALNLSIPFFGMIRIARGGNISKEPLEAMDTKTQTSQTPWAVDGTGSVHVANSIWSINIGQPSLEIARPLVDSTEAAQLSQMMIEPQTQSIPTDIPSPHATARPITGAAMDLEGPFSYTNLVASMDEWAFQGVDTAFFDSVMRGASVAVGDEGATTNTV